METRKNFYLFFKEAVNRFIMHSRASELTVGIFQKKNQLELVVRDNGIGFDPAKEMADHMASGNGLKNLQERAAAVNGKLQIDSLPGTGTSLTLSFPLI
jgi:signal transduction histidine kinase